MDDQQLPPFVLAERDALLVEIYQVFEGVRREGGVSWLEAEVIDFYGTAEQRAAARAKERDHNWQELVDKLPWDYESGIGGWSFLDAIGFRYYLPAGMVVSIRLGYDAGILFHLSLPKEELRKWSHDKWSALDLAQRLCVKRFLQYMTVVSGYRMSEYDTQEWREALESYWGRISSSNPNPDI